MNNLEETYQHPGITCKHELNISDFETFANELSQKLNLNIEMSYHRSSILYNKTFSKDGIKEKDKQDEVMVYDLAELILQNIKNT